MATFKELNRTTASDIDGLKMKPIAYVIDLILPYVTHIMNLCISNAVFPQRMQVARVSVIFKKGDRNNFGNYRPISVLPIFSKLLEKLIHKRLVSFETQHHILTDSQFGFRKHLSTDLALLQQKEYILRELEKSRIVIGIFIDFAKAFDMINHDLLLRKLDCYGIRGHASSLLKSYLQHRKQAVSINGFLSETLSISSGVPQGSILGPFLFNIYINDIIRIAPLLKFIIYADDTSLFISGDNVDKLIDFANHGLAQLDLWTQKNALELNTTKTKVIVFRAKNKEINLTRDVCFRSVPLEVVPSFKTLGVIFNEKMSWDDHVDYVITKLSQVIGIVYRNRHVLPTNVKITIYRSLFHSRLNYGILTWGSTTQENLRKLQVLQKSFLRIVERVPLLHSTSQFFLKYKIIPIINLPDYALCRAYKREITRNTCFIQTLANLQKREQAYETRSRDPWKITTYRTTYGLHTLENRLPRLLNSLFQANIFFPEATVKELIAHFLS